MVPVLFVNETPGSTVVLVTFTVPLNVTGPAVFSILSAEGLVPPSFVTVVVPPTVTGAVMLLITKPASWRLAIEMLSKVT